MSGASERTNRRASGPVIPFLFLVVLNHSATFGGSGFGGVVVGVIASVFLLDLDLDGLTLFEGQVQFGRRCLSRVLFVLQTCRRDGYMRAGA